MQKSLRIISRNSTLALCQADYVKHQLESLYPEIDIVVDGVTTTGDKILDKSLSEIGGKGLFTKELEIALLDGSADLAVHSAKDLSVTISSEFTLSAYLEREDANDAFISNNYMDIDQLPPGAIIGTSSPRRIALLHKYYPEYQIKLLRGNVPTRLAKLDNGEYDGIIIAVAGLKRLGLTNRITKYLNTNKFIPAIGQGALAIEILAHNLTLHQLLQPLMHFDTYITVTTEREVGRVLKAGCSTPLAVHAVLDGDKISLEAYLADKENGQDCVFQGIASRNEYLTLALNCANTLLDQGAEKILQRC